MTRIARGRLKAAAAGIEDFAPTGKCLRPALQVFQQIRKCRNRAIVQIWCAQPQSVQGFSDVALEFLEMAKVPVITLSITVVSIACRGRPHVDAMPISLNCLNRD